MLSHTKPWISPWGMVQWWRTDNQRIAIDGLYKGVPSQPSHSNPRIARRMCAPKIIACISCLPVHILASLHGYSSYRDKWNTTRRPTIGTTPFKPRNQQCNVDLKNSVHLKECSNPWIFPWVWPWLNKNPGETPQQAPITIMMPWILRVMFAPRILLASCTPIQFLELSCQICFWSGLGTYIFAGVHMRTIHSFSRQVPTTSLASMGGYFPAVLHDNTRSTWLYNPICTEQAVSLAPSAKGRPELDIWPSCRTCVIFATSTAAPVTLRYEHYGVYPTWQLIYNPPFYF